MSSAAPLLSVAEALAKVLASAPTPLASEAVKLSEAAGRTLAEPLAAKRTQPPFAASAMDGYAVRADDLKDVPVVLKRIGMSAAGHGFAGNLGPGETVRIFTGAPLPAGADTIVIQENVEAKADAITFRETTARGRHIRPAGLDFVAGDEILTAGSRLGPRQLALAAAANFAELPVARKPRVAILATGDELVMPGELPGRDQIVASNAFAIAAFVSACGGEPLDLGIAQDTFAALESGIERARRLEADVLVTLGGASVGDHDLVHSALSREGMELGFWKIAMRPGKPMMHGRLGDMRILGLPGNPVSSIVCAVLFLRPLVRALLGDNTAAADPSEPAQLGVDVAANDGRQDYVRASLLRPTPDGLPIATPWRTQDSSMLRLLSEAECLLLRPPRAPAAAAGDPCRIIRFDRIGM